jgi:hypothetical protein
VITKKQRSNANRMVELADAFGHLDYNAHGQQVEELLNLSIPCARLVKAGVVTGVEDTYDGINDQALEVVERYCRVAIDRLNAEHGEGWWSERAALLKLWPGKESE